jgi:dipeptidyl aminopeptidase/acylaminoacyl peptidase
MNPLPQLRFANSPVQRTPRLWERALPAMLGHFRTHRSRMNPLPRLRFVDPLGQRLLLMLFCLIVHTGLAAQTGDRAPAAINASHLAAALAVERARTPADRLDRRAYIDQDPLKQVSLSPQGRAIAWLQRAGERVSVWVMDADGDNARPLLAQTDATQLFWSRDGRWLFAQSPSRLLALSATGDAGSSLMATLKTNDRNAVFGVDPGHPAAMLLIERPTAAGERQPSSHQLWRVDRQGARTLLHEDRLPLVDFAFDPQGRLTWVKRFEGEAFAILHLGADGSQTQLGRCAPMRRCTLISGDAAGGLWLIGNLGIDRAGLQHVAKDGSVRTLHTDPRGEADLRAIDVDPGSHRPLIAHYASSMPNSHALEPEVDGLLARLNHEFPESRLQISQSPNPESTLLIGVGNSQSPRTRWYTLAGPDGALKPILTDLQPSAFTDLENAAARKIAVNWLASDGLRLQGMVSVPPGLEASMLPLVVKVHGGPWSLTGPEYSASTQFLVNRGYAVFEPNFRGSIGLGREYLLAARGDFGQGRVQRDVVEGTRWLLSQGVGDAERVAIVGASFGGYSALLGVTHQPDLYRLAIAAVPPSDFAWTLRWAVEHQVLELESTVPFEQTLRALDLDLADASAMQGLSAGSPLAQAQQLTRPVVLFAGGLDERVAIRSVTHYAARLLQLGKDVDLYIEKRGGHEPDGAVPREAWLYLLEHSLQRELGGISPAPPGTELANYLRRNQRIARGRLQP